MINLRPLTLIVEKARLSQGATNPDLFFQDVLDRLSISPEDFIVQDNPYALDEVTRAVTEAAQGSTAQWPVKPGLVHLIAKAHGRTMSDVAQILGKSRSYLYNLNASDRPPPQAIRSIMALRWFRFSSNSLSPHLFSEAVPDNPVEYLLRLSGVTPATLTRKYHLLDLALPTVKRVITEKTITYDFDMHPSVMPLHEGDIGPLHLTRNSARYYGGEPTPISIESDPLILDAALGIPSVFQYVEFVKDNTAPEDYKESVRLYRIANRDARKQGLILTFDSDVAQCLIDRGTERDIFDTRLALLDKSDPIMVQDVLRLHQVKRAIRWYNSASGTSWYSTRGRTYREHGNRAAKELGIKLNADSWKHLVSAFDE